MFIEETLIVLMVKKQAECKYLMFFYLPDARSMTLTEESTFLPPIRDNIEDGSHHKWDINDNTLPLVRINLASFCILSYK